MAARRHVMTPARKAALKKAQAASARKRRGKGKGKLAKANRKNTSLKRVLAYAAVGAGVALAAHGVGHFSAHKRSARYRY